MSGDITPEFLAAVSKETGVPEWLLTAGGVNTTEGIWSRARDAVDWKAATAPAAPRTAAVSPSSHPTRVSMQQLVPGDDWLGAWRAGRLTPRGAPQPPPRRNNGHNQQNEP